MRLERKKKSDGIESLALPKDERTQKLESRLLLMSSSQAKREHINWNTIQRIKKGEKIKFKGKTFKKYGIENQS